MGKTQKRIAKASSKLKRKRKPEYKKKIKASNRWRKQNSKISKLKTKAANQRENWQHQVTSEIVSRNSLVSCEELNIKAMTKKPKKGSKHKRARRLRGKLPPQSSLQKSGLNRSILDVGMGAVMSCLEYKLQEAGGFLVKVPTRKIKPSQTCPKCHHQKKKQLKERQHICEQCGYSTGRDVASAQICFDYATTGLGTSLDARGVRSSTVTACGG